MESLQSKREAELVSELHESFSLHTPRRISTNESPTAISSQALSVLGNFILLQFKSHPSIDNVSNRWTNRSDQKFVTEFWIWVNQKKFLFVCELLFPDKHKVAYEGTHTI